MAEAQWNDLAQVVHDEIGQLPERYRAPIVLCDMEGLTEGQAARQLGRPVGTIRSQLSRGRQRLRDRLIRRSGSRVRSSGRPRASLRRKCRRFVCVTAFDDSFRDAIRDGEGGSNRIGIQCVGRARRGILEEHAHGEVEKYRDGSLDGSRDSNRRRLRSSRRARKPGQSATPSTKYEN